METSCETTNLQLFWLKQKIQETGVNLGCVNIPTRGKCAGTLDKMAPTPAKTDTKWRLDNAATPLLPQNFFPSFFALALKIIMRIWSMKYFISSLGLSECCKFWLQVLKRLNCVHGSFEISINYVIQSKKFIKVAVHQNLEKNISAISTFDIFKQCINFYQYSFLFLVASKSFQKPLKSFRSHGKLQGAIECFKSL